MVERRLLKEIIRSLGRSPSVSIVGPRQVGKTTLAIEATDTINSIYLDLEDNQDLLKVEDIVMFHQANKDQLIVLDEVQQLPDIFKQIRGIIDKERRRGNRNGLFLFLGSASRDLLRQSGESLAGRISYKELFPIDVLEYAHNDFEKTNRLWSRGGFPESLLSNNDTDSFTWRKDFIKTYLERDIPQLGPRIPAKTLERFWTMLAHNQGSVFNASQISRSLDVSHTTVIRYLDLMIDLLLVRRLQPYTFNIGKRLVKSPKIYVRDSGITHTLLNIRDYDSLIGHPILGNSWECFVIENILSACPSYVGAYYYRTAKGAEIDLILEFGPKKLWAIEIKRSSAPNVSKGFYSACEDLKPERKYVVYSGQDTFPIKDDIIVTSVYNLMTILVELDQND